MQDYIIMTDSTCDLPLATIEQEEIEVAPLTFSFGEEEYRDLPGGGEMDHATFFQKLRAGQMPTTAQVNPGTFQELFSSILQSGKNLLYIAFSSALSGTYNSAKLAAEKLAALYPQQKIMVVDSLSGSLGQGLLVECAAKLKESGRSLQEVADWLVEKSTCVQHWFTVDDLNFLKRGGRISAALAACGTILSIKPILNLNQKGAILPVAKIRGRKRALSFLAEKIAAAFDNPQQTIYISHADCLEDGQSLVSLLEEKVNPKKIVLLSAGPIISSHVGPGALGVYFLGKKRPA